MIRINIIRDDGEVTQLEGHSGMATCMGPIMDPMELSDPPTVSLRCSTKAELAWNLAAMIAAVEHYAPEAAAMARELAPLCSFDRPHAHRRLPRPRDR